MKFHLGLCALLVCWALVPAILADEGNPSSLWAIIRDKFQNSPHIINGDEATRNAFPHQVFLDIQLDGWGTFCSGSLIHPQWVLTAAHCVDNVSGVTAVLGVHDKQNLRGPSTQSIRVDRIFVEEQYRKKNTDIALLRLNKPATLNQFVQTIRIPAKSMKGKNLAGTPAEVIGWGKFKLPDGGVSSVLRHARTKVISNEDCGKMGFKDSITEWRICSERSDGKGPCRGDSGGPIFMTEKDAKTTLIGIISYGSTSCAAPSPSVYTRVDHWLEWINKLTGIPLRD